MFGEHSARLVDVLTGQSAFSGDRVAIERLARFNFPVEWATEDLKEDQIRSRDPLAPGDFVAALFGRRVHVCRIERLLGDTQLEVVRFEIPHGQRYGPWTRRPWRATIGHAGEAGKEVIPTADVLIHVELSDEALTVRSLERLAAAGLDLTGVPHLEASLPRPLAGQ